MRSYQIPHTNLQVSRVAYGCMRLAHPYETTPGAAQRRSAFAALESALRAGINCFDHADIYCRGWSERLFGAFLRSDTAFRDTLVIQSKCGVRRRDEPAPPAPARYDFSADHILNSVDGSLGRLGVERLDLLLLHRPDCLVEPEEVARAFDALETTGKVLAFGVSNHTAPQIELLKRWVRQPLVVNQVSLSLASISLIDDGVSANDSTAVCKMTAGTLDYCRLNDILVQAYSPLGGGRLLQSAPTDSRTVGTADAALRTMAASKGVSAAALALAWLLRHPAGIQPVIGSTDPARIAMSAAGDEVSMSREEWYTLFEAARGSSVP